MSRSHDTSTTDCSICHEILSDQLSICYCGHIYHTNCIIQWLSHNKLCPLCKQTAKPLIQLACTPQSYIQKYIESNQYRSKNENSNDKLSTDRVLQSLEHNRLTSQIADHTHIVQQLQHKLDQLVIQYNAYEIDYNELTNKLNQIKIQKKQYSDELQPLHATYNKLHTNVTQLQQSLQQLQLINIGNGILNEYNVLLQNKNILLRMIDYEVEYRYVNDTSTYHFLLIQLIRHTKHINQLLHTQLMDSNKSAAQISKLQHDNYAIQYKISDVNKKNMILHNHIVEQHQQINDHKNLMDSTTEHIHRNIQLIDDIEQRQNVLYELQQIIDLTTLPVSLQPDINNHTHDHKLHSPTLSDQQRSTVNPFTAAIQRTISSNNIQRQLSNHHRSINDITNTVTANTQSLTNTLNKQLSVGSSNNPFDYMKRNRSIKRRRKTRDKSTDELLDDVLLINDQHNKQHNNNPSIVQRSTNTEVSQQSMSSSVMSRQNSGSILSRNNSNSSSSSSMLDEPIKIHKATSTNIFKQLNRKQTTLQFSHSTGTINNNNHMDDDVVVVGHTVQHSRTSNVDAALNSLIELLDDDSSIK